MTTYIGDTKDCGCAPFSETSEVPDPEGGVMRVCQDCLSRFAPWDVADLPVALFASGRQVTPEAAGSLAEAERLERAAG